MDDRKEIIKLANDAEETQSIMRQNVDKFAIYLNKPPEKEKILKRAGFEYLPISHYEMLLDELFLQQWTTQNFQYKQILNEITASLELVVLHPITGRELKRVGAASIVIQQKSQSNISTLVENKIKNALELGLPRLKTECIKNACKSLGKRFGRDINRKIEDEYISLIPKEPIPDEIDLSIQQCSTLDDIDRIWKDNKPLQMIPKFQDMILTAKNKIK